jgi:hypothetical protein
VPAAAWDQNPKWFKFRGAGRRLAAAEQPRAGRILELACSETADSAPQNLTPRSVTSKPGKESWDFDGSMLTSVRKETRQCPMLTHETSPVLGASDVGMTSRVGQGQC